MGFKHTPMKIDFKLFKKQRFTLNNILANSEYTFDQGAFTKKQIDALEGIRNLLEALSDEHEDGKKETDFDLMVLLYLKLEFPRYTDKFLLEDNKGKELSDEEYNAAFFEMVDIVREKFLDKEGDDESHANQIVEHYMSDEPFK